MKSNSKFSTEFFLNEHNSFFSYTVIIFVSIYLSFVSDIIFRKSVADSLVWVINNPLAFIWNCMIVLLLSLLLYSLSNVKVSLIITSIIVLSMSFFDSVKFSLRGIHLIPEDLKLFNEVLSITEVVISTKIIALLLYLFLVLALLIIFVLMMPSSKIRKLDRGILFLVTFIVFTGIMNFVTFEKIYGRENITVENDGYILYFSSNLNENSRGQYAYSDDESYKNSLLKEYDEHKITNKKPNIIVIMNEAFWDPSVMKNLDFENNITPNITRLKENSIHGYLKTSEFGGGTANVEFELLTGNSTLFYESGYMIYPNEIKEPLMSLASILRKQDYKTKAIHSYVNWYWDRQKVYKYLGFDDFISVEYFNNPEYKGFFVSDEYVTDKIIEELENEEESTFIFAVTMQNHGPYNDNRYKDFDLDIGVNNELDVETLQMLNTFSQGIYDADKALGKLTNYIDNIDEPTIVLFFGDHLPLLGMDLKAYKELEYVKGYGSNEDKLKLYSVPFIMHSNYINESKDIGTINVSFMGSYLLRYAGLEMPQYFKQLYNYSQMIPVISKLYAIDKNHNFIASGNYDEYNKLYKNLQFENMYKEKNEENNKWIISENSTYNSNLKNSEIENIVSKDNITIIKGSNFYPTIELYIDRKKENISIIDSNTIHINRSISKSSQLQIKLYDTKKNLLFESDIYNVEN